MKKLWRSCAEVVKFKVNFKPYQLYHYDARMVARWLLGFLRTTLQDVNTDFIFFVLNLTYIILS